MDVLNEFSPELVSNLPMQDVNFLAHLKKHGLLSGNTKAKIKGADSAPDAADFFLDNVITPALNNDNLEPFEKMLLAMDEFGDGNLKGLANKIRQKLRGESNGGVGATGGGLTGSGASGGGTSGFDANATILKVQEHYSSLNMLRIASMLDTLYTKGIVTFEEKGEIEAAGRKGMQWFLDNVLIADLKQGQSTKYKMFLKVMESHDNTTIKKVAEYLGGSKSVPEDDL